MTQAQLKKQETKVEALKKKTARAEFELDMLKADWDIKHGKGKLFKTSAELRRYVNTKLR